MFWQQVSLKLAAALFIVPWKLAWKWQTLKGFQQNQIQYERILDWNVSLSSAVRFRGGAFWSEPRRLSLSEKLIALFQEQTLTLTVHMGSRNFVIDWATSDAYDTGNARKNYVIAIVYNWTLKWVFILDLLFCLGFVVIVFGNKSTKSSVTFIKSYNLKSR